MRMTKAWVYVGDKKLKRADGQEEIAKSKRWSLHRLPMSDCGRFQNYRLYLDLKNVPKNVFWIAVKLKTKELVKNADLEIMRAAYPGMEGWFLRTIAGEKVEAPIERGTKAKIIKIPFKPDEKMKEVVASFVHRAAAQGKPLSAAGQSRVSGRYAPKYIADRMSLPIWKLKMTMEQMIAEGELETVVFNSTTKLKGLRLVQQIGGTAAMAGGANG